MSRQQYPLQLNLRTPTPEDLVRASEKGVVPLEQDELIFGTVSKEDAEKLDKRLPKLEVEEDDEKEFFKRQETAKPPTAEKIQLQAFPPKDSFETQKQQPEESIDEVEKNENEKKKLVVERYLPVGSVPLASYLSVTFNNSMVKLSSVQQVEKEKIPIELSPKCEGRWRWIGTKTLYFEPTFRFNNSTTYTVKIPAGTKDVQGLTLEEDVTWTFETSTMKLTSHLPNSQFSDENPVFYLHFDQKINPDDVVKHLKLNSLSDQFEVITEDEARKLVEKQPQKQRQPIEYFIKSSVKDRFMWMKLKNTLKLAENYQVVIDQGAPSAEGPNTTKSSQHFQFSTYGKMAVSGQSPDREQESPPNHQWTIYFTNQIDGEKFKVEDELEISPTMKDVSYTINDRYIIIMGRNKGSTTYTVTVKTGIVDIYGQKLHKEETVSYKVGKARQSLKTFHSGVIVIDPTEKQPASYSVISCNLTQFRCAIFQVDPKDYQKSYWGTNSHRIKDYKNYDITEYCQFGKKVFDGLIDVKCEEDETVETLVDIIQYLQNPDEKLGQLYIVCEPVKKEWKDLWETRAVAHCWIQCTQLAVDLIMNTASCDLCCWANSLKDGSPLTDVEFTYHGTKKKVDSSGMTHFDLSTGFLDFWDHSLVVARLKNDVAFVNHIPTGYQSKEEHLHHTFDDRKLYKPKEKVTIKGYVRKLARDKISYKLEHDTKWDIINWEVLDASWVSYTKGSTKLNDNGSFLISFDVPDNVSLGNHVVQFKMKKDSFLSFFYGSNYFEHSFTVQEFRTPEYKVNVSSSSASFVGDTSGIFTVNSSYFSGGALTAAKVDWTVTQMASNYTPPGHTGFHFQKPEPFWYLGIEETEEFKDDVGAVVMGDQCTDSNGDHKICVEFKETDRHPKRPVTISASADVQDLSNQVMSSSSSFIVHPSSIYVGVKSNKIIVQPEETIRLEIVSTTIKGLFTEDVPITIKAIKHVDGKTKETKVDAIVKSEKKAFSYELSLKEPGAYTIELEGTDQDGQKNSTGMFVYVEGGLKRSQSSKIIADSLIIVANKGSYKVGDTADVFIQHPYDSAAHGVFTVLCTGVHTQKRIEMKDKSCILKIPITKEMIPGARVHVELVSSTYRVDFNLENIKDADKKPAFASGSVELSVPPLIHQLNAAVKPKNEICLPGAETEVEVVVTDFEGKSVTDSEVTLVVVDEAILSLTPYSISNPLTIFYPAHRPGYVRKTLRSEIFVKDWSTWAQINPYDHYGYESRFALTSGGRGGMERMMKSEERMELMECDESLQGISLSQAFGDSAGGLIPQNQSTSKPIAVRSNFNPLATFATGTTDKSGKVILKFTLPDNLTEYRVTAVVTHKFTSFGIGDASIVANLPLMIRPSAPRFLNFGDSCTFPVILQNQSNDKLDVNFTIKVSNLKLVSPEKFEYLNVSIPPKNRIVVKYPVETIKAGIGRFQIGAEVIGTSHADAVNKQFPIFTPSTSEAFATYGQLDEGCLNQPITKPPNVFSQYGGVQVSTSSTAVQALTDAFLYIYNYSFEYTEQLASRMLSIVALENVLYAFSAPGVPPKFVLKALMEINIKKLIENQRQDGAFGYWNASSPPSIYLSIHVAHCFQRCIEQGYTIPSQALDRSKSFLINIENFINMEEIKSESTKNSLRLFALYVLTLMKYDKSEVSKRANNLAKSLDSFTLDAIAWLLVSLHYSDPSSESIAIILKKIQNSVIDSPEAISFTTHYSENHDAQLVMLHSDRRTDAIILDALIEIDPKNEMIPKIVKGLLKHRVKGKWGSTCENCYILLALKKYFDVYEKEEPNFSLKIWLGDDTFVGEQVFKGRTTEKNLIEIPMSFIAEKSDNLDILIQKEGKGRMYYRIGMSYSPKDFHLDALDYGFVVERTYEPVSNEGDVVLNKDGSWTIREGQLVKVKIKMTNTSVRYHVALVDYLPGGFEALNPDLPIGGSKNTTQNVELKKDEWWWYYSTWYNHQNIRDERVESFARYLYPSVHSYNYLARATTKGKFIAPPAKAEEMYSPEVFGRSKSEIVFIE